MSWLDRVNYTGRAGLVNIVVQDAATGEVLRVGHADPQALRSMHESGLVTLISTGRRYVCGEGEGEIMRVADLWLNDTGEALLVRVRPARPGRKPDGTFHLVESREP